MNGRSRKTISDSLSSTDRDERIGESLRTQGQVEIAALALQLKVSEMTIRRDLDRLASIGRLRRVRGGAVAVGPAPFAQRAARRAGEKEMIAEKLVDLVNDGGAIAMDASTTVLRLALMLRGMNDLMVLTNGPETFFALQDFEGVTPILSGGKLDKRTGGLVGPIAIRSTEGIATQRAFVSAAALAMPYGSTEATLEDAEAKLAIVDTASSVVLAVDQSKLGHHSTARCLLLDRVDILVTDLNPSDHRLDDFRDHCQIL